MKERFKSLKRELAPDPAFLDALEAKMTRELRKSQHRKPVRRKSNSIAILFAATILLEARSRLPCADRRSNRFA